MSLLIEQFESHIKLSTKKRIDGMTKDTASFLRVYLNDYCLNFITYNKQTLQRYLLDKELAYSTKATIASGLGKFMAYEGYITEAEYSQLKQSFRHPVNSWSDKYLSDEQVIDFIKEANKGTFPLNRRRNVCFVAMLAVIGGRVSQLCELDISDVLITELEVQVTLTRKKERRANLQRNLDIKCVPLGYKLGCFTFGELVRRYYIERSDYPGEAFFISTHANRLPINTAEVIIKELGKKLGLNVTPHTFRHYVGSKIANEKSIHKAAIWLGHKNITTTMKYINPETEDIYEHN